ncbi:hypothetical protein LEP1GSC058_0894 [Leptospira fainei serovar Hurstbridge str. BUT 6]|uniref:Activator of Hsp90 ATPase homologue 1/2-like C-terminal domain-containing protein n=1 Tax=Leptospira fainei serovar Hurstbridge str. BUT 6 TaxID=1193011 RepID=S3UQC0_9LEPT|nr:SRPBCC domain-containing protein [Leptospira fainei]EPG72601.1 hypothetical protein LEP1GSC058_0894 [Leptospira fainei serovar Hurstbridge str. BUT 6]
MKTENITTQIEGKEFIISRVFDAPRDLVWKAWTEQGRMTQWWGPKGFNTSVAKLDLRPGGVLHYGMKSPDGLEMWGRFVYREIVPPERIVFVDSFSDQNCGVTRHPLSETWPLEVLNVLTLTEQEGKTVVTIKAGPINATEEEINAFLGGYESMRKGFAGIFDQLAVHLAKT